MKPNARQRATVGCTGAVHGGQRQPGKQLYRISRLMPEGGMRTFEDAQVIAKTKPWWTGVAYLGSDSRWYLWQQT